MKTFLLAEVETTAASFGQLVLNNQSPTAAKQFTVSNHFSAWIGYEKTDLLLKVGVPHSEITEV